MAGATAIKLEFVSSFSPLPMSESSGPSRDAHSRVAFSRASATIKVRITDDDGNTITTGPDSTQEIAIQPISILEDMDAVKEYDLQGKTWVDFFNYPDAKVCFFVFF